ncbi:hypothetical protein ACOMHN_016119 [Nucella lapillus]
MERFGYESIRFLAKGTFGEVMEVKEKESEKKRALKLVKYEHLKIAEDEVRINKSFRRDCPDCIARLTDDFRIDSGICMVFELLKGGNLHCWLNDHRPRGVSIGDFKVLSRRMFQALNYLEEKSIIHGDIKTNNFFLDYPYDPHTLKLGDFGMAVKLSSSQAPFIFPEQFMVLRYRPPEVMLGAPTNNVLSPDVWGVGCVLLHIVLGVPFFNDSENETNMSMLDKLFTHLGYPPQEMLDKSVNKSKLLKGRSEYPKDSKSLAHHIIGKKPSWMRSEAIGVYDIVRRALELNPDTRIRPRTMLNHFFIKQ